MDHIGIDVHKRESQICILGEGGTILEQRIRSEPERFAAVLGARPRARILIEASTDSEWVARCLEALGHEVIVADPNFALRSQRLPLRVLPDLRLPALSWLPGQMPVHEAAWAAVGKRLMSSPSSARICWPRRSMSHSVL